ncbi:MULTISPECIES: hypothetical protein [unclassified Nonomuraea]|uniref:hypothetical protein n=1 Tax=unclassified Nonomuraea TaxID=2593643 RepID=UPI0035C1D727
MGSADSTDGATPRKSRLRKRQLWTGVLGVPLVLVITLKMADTRGAAMAVIAGVVWSALVISEVAFSERVRFLERARPVLYGLAVYPLPVFTVLAVVSPFLSLAICAIVAGIVTLSVVVLRAYLTPRPPP